MSYCDYKIPLPDSKINSELEILRKEIKYLNKCNVQDGQMVYRVKPGTAKYYVQNHIQPLIEELGLELIAVPTTLLADDSFIIKFQSDN